MIVTWGNRLARQVGAWPPRARWLWWGMRPLCTAVALGAAVVYLVRGGNVAAACTASALAVLVRPVRRPGWGLVAAALAGWLVPATGAAVAVRTLLGVLAIRLAGATWWDGLETAVRARRRLISGTPDVATADDRLRALGQQSADEAVDTVRETVVAAWATADLRWMIGSLATLAKLIASGRNGVAELPAELDLMRPVLLDRMVKFCLRLLCGAGAVALLAQIWSSRLDVPSLLLLQDGALRRTTSYAVTFLLVYNVVSLSRRGFVYSAVLLGVAVAAGGWAAVAVLTCVGIGCATYVRARSSFSKSIVGPGPVSPRPRLPRWTGSRRGRETWRTAQEAQWVGRAVLERVLWTEIVSDERESVALRVCAAAALARMALDATELQNAVAWVTTALGIRGEARLPPVVEGYAWTVSSQVYRAVGDHEESRRLLHLAAIARYRQLDPAVDLAERLTSLDVTGSRTVDMLAERIADAVRWRDGRRLVGLLQIVHDDPGVGVVQSRGYLELGRLQLDDGDHRAAAASLRRAVTGFATPSTAVEQAVARTLLGVATSALAPHRALPEMTTGLRALEDRRGTLAAGSHRSALIVRHAHVYEQVFAAARRLQDGGVAAGRLAAEVIESLRRGSLASMLRSGSQELGPAVLRLRGELAALEDREDIEPVELRRVRRELATQLSALFATAYVPEPVRDQDLGARTGTAHVLAYHLHEVSADRVRGHVVWTPGRGEPVLAAVEIDDADLLDLVGAPGSAERRAGLMARRQDAEQVDLWRRLGAALLPDTLRSLLTALPDGAAERIVVVPHGPLAALPWAALRLADGQPLLTVAEVQVVPSLGFLRGAGDRARAAAGGTVLVHLAEPGSTAEARALRELDGRRVDDRAAFLDGLADRPAGAYIAAHGDEEGLSQAVTFRHGGDLSASTALGREWPAWVVFASCLVGRIDFTLGEEPLGLPVSCVLGGADTVIGGVVEVGYAAGVQAARTAVRLRRGEHPAAALRAEQLRLLDRYADAPPTVWAGLVCITRLQSAG